MSYESASIAENFVPQLTNSLVFLSPNLDDQNSLIPALSSDSKLFMLDSSRDSIEQISEVLSRYSNVSSIHIVSHGDPGSLDLGTTQLDTNNLSSYHDAIAGWAGALTDSADILLYGCNIASGELGQNFVQALGQLTGADVTASDNLTGNQALGGDWVLEYNTGSIEAEAIHGETYSSILHSDFTEFLETFSTTHTAVKNGSWFDSATWGGSVPGNEAGVYIPEGRIVTYGGESSTRLKTVRVEGALNFATDKNSSMLVDTLGVAPTGQLNIGTATNPIQADKKVAITFRSDTTINTNVDKQQFGKGLVSHGQARIYGADKLDHVALSGDALKGSRELVLNSTPTGWKVGDQLVVGGTDYNYGSGSNADNSLHQDEVLTITAINGNRISFTNKDIKSGDNTVLRFDHKRPAKYVNDYSLKLYVANTTRNVVFQSEQGASTPIKNRGHVMFMDNPDVIVNNAGFYNLGRTDKSKPIDDVGTNFNGTVGKGTNIRGRYSLHIHRTGDKDIKGTSAKIVGNAVVGSPGWGIAHHASNAILDSNVVFDVFGAGFMSEAGTELGAWRNNIAIKTKDATPSDGYNPPEESRHLNYDLGQEGDGFWVQGSGAGIEITNNIAISNEGAGIDFHHERFGRFGNRDKAEPGAAKFAVKNLTPELQSAFTQLGLTEVDIAVLPIRKFSGFETYNSRYGMNFYNVSRNENGQGSFSNPHEVTWAFNGRSRLQDFKLWNVYGVGIGQAYTSMMDFVDGLIVGMANSPYKTFGIYGNGASINQLYKNLRVEGFPIGLRVPGDNHQHAPLSIATSSSRLENSFLSNGTNFDNFESRNAPNGGYLYPDYFKIINTQFQYTGSNATPTANFTSQGVGGLAQAFDASTSSDGVSGGSNRSIVAYGWDFNNDGKVDKFGRQVKHVFTQPGSKTITLKVWDNDGAIGTKTQTVNVSSTAYPNLIVDGNFSAAKPFMNQATVFDGGAADGPDLYSNAAANYGWTISPSWSGITSWTRTNGTALIKTSVSGTPGTYNGILGQVIGDDYTRRGQQQLNLTIKNTEGSDGVANKLTLKVWGVNGEFAWDNSGPRRFGALPTPGITKLLEQTVGGTTFDWKNFNWNVNFGNGYQFVLVQVVPQNINLSRGDYLVLDNFKIDASAPVTLSLSDSPQSDSPQDIDYAVATSNTTLTESNSGTQPLTFTVTRSGALQEASSVNYSLGGTATSGSDYNSIGGTSGATGLTGTINFVANETSKTITLNVLGDTVVEPDETVQVTLSNGTAPNGTATIVTANATTTIVNDEINSNSDIITIEAEQFSNNISQGGHNWVSIDESSASGGKALQAGPDNGANVNTSYVTNSPRLDYDINFANTGTYYVWIIGKANSSSVGTSDSIHAGLDGQSVSTADRISNFTKNYGWSNKTMDSEPATINVTSTGLHTFNLWMREDGFVVDKFILTLDPNFKPL